MKSRYKAWPFSEASSLSKRIPNRPDHPVTFETGFGPSGLPHIGTFAEVARTGWVRKAFEQLTGWPTRLVAFSDDMDGLRKVPVNLPRQEMLQENLGKPLSQIPDPFGEEESYSTYMNKKLRQFLDAYGFDYQFQSAYEAYSRGDFDQGLSLILRKTEEIRALILPTMKKESGEGWSPFFPVCEKCGRIYSTKVTGYNTTDDTIDYICNRTTGEKPGCGFENTTSIHRGKVKVGWKVDWALRWYSYEVAYEMYGKDLIESASLSSKIIRIMGKQPPSGFFYELFLDEEGKKISKSIGKGLTVDAWVSYAPIESLLNYLFPNPKRAKRLFWDIVPRSVDDYLSSLRNYDQLDEEKKAENAIWYIFKDSSKVPGFGSSINFTLIENLISGLGTDDPGIIKDFLERYDSTAKEYPVIIDDLIHKSLNYYRDFILPKKQYKKPTEHEKHLLKELAKEVKAHPDAEEEVLQAIPFRVAESLNLKPQELFQSFYTIILGQDRGPRFGTFARLVGIKKVIEMIDEAVRK